MLPLPAFLAPSSIYARMLNALLQREDWASHRLSRHSGKVVCFVVGKLQGRLLIQSDGYVAAADAAIVPDVTLTIPTNKLGELSTVLQTRDPALIASLMHIQGDAGLASVVSDLAKDLRWDIESDISRIVGDIPAARLMGAGKALFAGAQLAANRLGGNVSEYLTEESGLMANRMAYDNWTVRVQAVQQQLDALDARVSAIKVTRTITLTSNQA